MLSHDIHPDLDYQAYSPYFDKLFKWMDKKGSEESVEKETGSIRYTDTEKGLRINISSVATFITRDEKYLAGFDTRKYDKFERPAAADRRALPAYIRFLEALPNILTALNRQE